jgi:hypothetical protein
LKKKSRNVGQHLSFTFGSGGHRCVEVQRRYFKSAKKIFQKGLLLKRKRF